MTLTVHAKMEQRSDEWYAARCGMVTASVVGTLLTPKLEVADNASSRKLTALLVAERITGIVEPTFTNADMFRGLEAEDYVRCTYSEHWGHADECGFMCLQAEDGFWRLGYSPDGVVGEDGLIEVKAPRAKEHLRTILADEVPAEYVAQCQAALFVSGRKWIDYVSFHGGMPLWRKRVFPERDWQTAILAAVVNFEENAAAMVAEYEATTVGLPMTERLDLEMVV